MFLPLVFALLLPSAWCDTCMSTLYSYDVLRNGLSLPKGRDRMTYSLFYPYLAADGVDLQFVNFTKLVIAPEGTRIAASIDLGTDKDILAKYPCPTCPADSTYLSIHQNFTTLKLVLALFYPKLENETARFQNFTEKDLLPLRNVVKEPALDIVVNHIYLINITNTTKSTHFNRVAKLLVLSLSNTSVTIRWDVLIDTDARGTCHCQPNEPTAHDDNILGENKTAGWVSALIVIMLIVVICLVGCVCLLFMKVKQFAYSPIPP